MSFRYFVIWILVIGLYLSNSPESRSQGPAENFSISMTGSFISDACYGNTCLGYVSSTFDVINHTGTKVFRGVSVRDSNGFYKIPSILKPGEQYTVVVNDTGFLRNMFLVAIPNTTKYDELSKDFLVIPKVKEAKMAFHVSPFDYKETHLRVGVSEYLDEVAMIIRFNPKVKFAIACFPDNDENTSTNYVQTLERCKAVKNYLLSKGIPDNEIELQTNVKSDPYNPPPVRKMAKGKGYVGTTYLKVEEF